eukprot:scaffold3901_cov135-Skeletonema_menzelii.AAC.8
MDLFQCPICHDILKDAVSIRQCGHDFCKHCIQNWLKIQRSCPICRASTNNHEDVQPCHLLRLILEIAKQLSHHISLVLPAPVASRP